MRYTFGEFLRLIVGEQLSDKTAVEGAQIIEVAVARTEIDHIEEGTFGRGHADIVLYEDAIHATPEQRINLAERVEVLVNLNRPREIADRCDAIVILEDYACALQHELKRHIGGVIHAACQFFRPVAAFCVNAFAGILQQPLPDVSVQLCHNCIPALSCAHHGYRLRSEDRSGTIEYPCNKNFL